MYTTLALLKASDACVPGYGRMISFFGLAPSVKEQKIPLHVVALVGGPEDFGWALSNGVILDEEEYKQFYRRNLPFAFRAMMADRGYGSRVSSTNSDYKKKPFLWDLIKEAKAAVTFEQCEAFLAKIRLQHHSHWLFTEIARNEAWNSPCEFINYCVNKVQSNYTNSFWNWPKASEAPSIASEAPSAAPTSAEDEDEDEDGYQERDDEDDDEEHDRPSRSRRAPARRSIPTTNQYWFKSTITNRSHGQNIAHLFSDDPYEFMSKLKFKMPKGVTIKEVNGKPTMVTAVEDTKSMFDLIRTMTNKSHTDADQDD